MTKKLSPEEMSKSTIAVNEFKHSCMEDHENQGIGTIIVEKSKGDVLTFDNQNFRVVLGTNYHSVDIYWDEFFPNYQQEGLFHGYRTDYVKMKSSYKELTIFSGRLKIIIRA